MDITVQELKQKLDNKEEFLFLDVREAWEYSEFNLGATLVPLGTVINAIEDLKEHKNKEMVVHCRSGQRSAMAQQMFQQAGYTNVRNLEGGVLAWQETFGS